MLMARGTKELQQNLRSLWLKTLLCFMILSRRGWSGLIFSSRRSLLLSFIAVYVNRDNRSVATIPCCCCLLCCSGRLLTLTSNVTDCCNGRDKLMSSSSKIPIDYNKVCGSNVTTCETVKIRIFVQGNVMAGVLFIDCWRFGGASEWSQRPERGPKVPGGCHRTTGASPF